MKRYTVATLLLLFSCSSADERLEKKRMSNNLSEEKIYRLSSEKVYNHSDLKLSKKELYPWENASIFPKISMDHFRCKGKRDRQQRKGNSKSFEDCGGLHDHGLPYVDGEEFVYPVMIKVLNNLQNTIEKRVVITAGHRCPKHNSYVTLGASKLTKFMIGAKVDFYVEGLEFDIDRVLSEIMGLYSKDKEEYQRFRSVKKANGSTEWRNKELLISIRREGEHSILQNLEHPIISIEVLYDRERGQAVKLQWDKAYNGFIRN